MAARWTWLAPLWSGSETQRRRAVSFTVCCSSAGFWLNGMFALGRRDEATFGIVAVASRRWVRFFFLFGFFSFLFLNLLFTARVKAACSTECGSEYEFLGKTTNADIGSGATL